MKAIILAAQEEKRLAKRNRKRKRTAKFNPNQLKGVKTIPTWTLPDYFYETENESILGEIECDNYFTVIYNTLR